MARCIALLFLAALLSGCMAVSEPVPPTGPSPVVAPDEADPVMVQSGCQSYYSRHKVDLAYADPRLPEGLDIYPWQGGALLTLKSWTCPDSEVDGAALASGAALVYYIAVVPQGQYANDSVGFSWYPLEIIASTNDLADLFREWGFTVATQGSVQIDWEPDTLPRLVTVHAKGGSVIDATVTLTGAGTTTQDFVVRYFAGDGNTVTGAVDIIVHPGKNGGNTPTLWTMDGPHAPGPAPLVGDSGYQGWDPGGLSYTWTPVRFDL